MTLLAHTSPARRRGWPVHRAGRPPGDALTPRLAPGCARPAHIMAPLAYIALDHTDNLPFCTAARLIPMMRASKTAREPHNSEHEVPVVHMRAMSQVRFEETQLPGR